MRHVNLAQWAWPDLHREEGDVVKVFDEASDLRALIFIFKEPRPSLDLHLGVRVEVRGQRSRHAPKAVNHLLGYLLVQRLHKPLVTHKVAGHVHITVVDQHPVLLHKNKYLYNNSVNNNNTISPSTQTVDSRMTDQGRQQL